MAFWDRIFGDDHARAEKYEGRESASQAASRKRRAGHRARVARDGDAAGMKIPRSLRRRSF